MPLALVPSGYLLLTSASLVMAASDGGSELRREAFDSEVDRGRPASRGAGYDTFACLALYSSFLKSTGFSPENKSSMSTRDCSRNL